MEKTNYQKAYLLNLNNYQENTFEGQHFQWTRRWRIPRIHNQARLYPWRDRQVWNSWSEELIAALDM